MREPQDGKWHAGSGGHTGTPRQPPQTEAAVRRKGGGQAAMTAAARAGSPALVLGGAGNLAELAKVAPQGGGLQPRQRRRQLAGGSGGGGCHGSGRGSCAALSVIHCRGSRAQQPAGCGRAQTGGARLERAEEGPRACCQHLRVRDRNFRCPQAAQPGQTTQGHPAWGVPRWLGSCCSHQNRKQPAVTGDPLGNHWSIA